MVMVSKFLGTRVHDYEKYKIWTRKTDGLTVLAGADMPYISTDNSLIDNRLYPQPEE